MTTQFVAGFDRVVSDMMRKFGTKADIRVAIAGKYNEATSEMEDAKQRDILVEVMFFDYLDKKFGIGTEGKSLIQSGDRQVYIRPPQKAGAQPLPHLSANSDFLVHDGKQYQIVFVKQLNTSMTKDGCVLYELYIRE